MSLNKKKMPRVLVNSLLLNDRFTGVQNYSEYLFQAMCSLKNKPVEIDILISQSYKGHLQNGDEFNLRKTNLSSTNRFKRIWYENFRLKGLSKAYDLFHSPSYVLPLFFRPVPSIITVHDIIALDHPEWCSTQNASYFNLTLPNSIRKCDKIIAVSQKVKQDILNRFDIRESKIHVIQLGVGSQFRKPIEYNVCEKIRKKYCLPQKYILFVGNLEPKKNIERVIEAFYHLRVQTSMKHKLLIAGKKGWKYQSIYNTITRLKMDDQIILTGYIHEDDLPVIYALSDGLVFPSLYEGFGLPILEAMASKIPVLTSTHGAAPETSGGYSIGVNPYNIDGIASGIHKLITDENWRAHAIEKGKKWSDQFTWENAARKTLELYYETVSS